MSEITQNGRLMTLADCDVCGGLMTRVGGIQARREMHVGLAERPLYYEQPETAYCFSCERDVGMIWVKSVKNSDNQPRPHYRGCCVRCLAFIGTSWKRTKLVPIKRKTLDKMRASIDAAQARLLDARTAEAERRAEVESLAEAERVKQGLAALQFRFAK